MSIRIFIDGACQPNPGWMGVGVVIEWANKLPQIISYGGGHGTNNIAEYIAFREALKQIHDQNIRVAQINSDSKLVVEQTTGKWQCKSVDLQPHYNYSRNLLKELKASGFNITIQYIPRELNIADSPAKKGCSLNGQV